MSDSNGLTKDDFGLQDNRYASSDVHNGGAVVAQLLKNAR